MATLIRVLGDIDLAEDAVAEAFAIAAQRWPNEGTPLNPGAWITTTARNRAIDRLRREATRPERHRAAEHLRPTDAGNAAAVGLDEAGLLDELAEVVADDQLRLLFLCGHPALSADGRVALSLRLLGGLEVAEIAAAFVVSESTMAKRLVRAKQKLRHNSAAYRIPSAAELPERLHVVLNVIYLVYTEGHRSSSTDVPVRSELTSEAVRLARLLSALLPDEQEASGLLALLLLTESRRAARFDAEGAFVRLADQDRTLWNRELIDEGHRLVRACLRRNQPGTFQIQAAIAAVHADASDDSTTDWRQVLALYDQLLAIRANPVVAINRAVAVARVRGAAAGLTAIDEVERTDAIDSYQPYHAVRADLLQRCGQHAAAVTEYQYALALTGVDRERVFLEAQRDVAMDALGSRPG